MPSRTVLWGNAQAELTFVTWGSTTYVCREAVRKLAVMGVKANILQVLYPWPFPSDEVKTAIEAAKTSVLVENNQCAQLGQLIQLHAGVRCNHQLLKYDGRPFWVEELVAFARNHV